MSEQRAVFYEDLSPTNPVDENNTFQLISVAGDKTVTIKLLPRGQVMSETPGNYLESPTLGRLLIVSCLPESGNARFERIIYRSILPNYIPASRSMIIDSERRDHKQAIDNRNFL